MYNFPPPIFAAATTEAQNQSGLSFPSGTSTPFTFSTPSPTWSASSGRSTPSTIPSPPQFPSSDFSFAHPLRPRGSKSASSKSATYLQQQPEVSVAVPRNDLGYHAASFVSAQYAPATSASNRAWATPVQSQPVGWLQAGQGYYSPSVYTQPAGIPARDATRAQYYQAHPYQALTGNPQVSAARATGKREVPASSAAACAKRAKSTRAVARPTSSSNQKPLQECPKCGCWVREMTRHKRAHYFREHPEARPACVKCGQMFSRRANLNRHKMTCTGEKVSEPSEYAPAYAPAINDNAAAEDDATADDYYPVALAENLYTPPETPLSFHLPYVNSSYSSLAHALDETLITVHRPASHPKDEDHIARPPAHTAHDSVDAVNDRAQSPAQAGAAVPASFSQSLAEDPMFDFQDSVASWSAWDSLVADLQATGTYFDFDF